MGRNVTRGLLRLWVVASVLWLAGQSVNIGTLLIDPAFDSSDTRHALLFGLIFALAPPLLVLVIVGGTIWVIGGFRRRAGDGAAWPAAPDRRPLHTWSTGETARLYDHLDDTWADLVREAAQDIMTTTEDGVSIWDRSPAGHRKFERRLRTAIEDRIDAFWNDGVQDHHAAHVAREVGSLWRVNWPELAARLLAEQGNVARRAPSHAPAPGDAAPHLNGTAATPASDLQPAATAEART